MTEVAKKPPSARGIGQASRVVEDHPSLIRNAHLANFFTEGFQIGERVSSTMGLDGTG